MILFETPRLMVRQYTIDDMESFFELNSDAEVMKYIRPVKNRSENDVFLRQVLEDSRKYPDVGRWAAIEKETQEIAGSFAIIPVDGTDRMQLGYALLQPYWGKGYATELTLGGLDYVRAKKLMDEIYALAETINHASCKVLEKTGFKRLEDIIVKGKEAAQYVYLF